jgi:hypothetical protein
MTRTTRKISKSLVLGIATAALTLGACFGGNAASAATMPTLRATSQGFV